MRVAIARSAVLEEAREFNRASAFRKPAPCVSEVVVPCLGRVLEAIALTRFGFRFGFACVDTATVPATTGDAVLVPLRLDTDASACSGCP